MLLRHSPRLGAPVVNSLVVAPEARILDRVRVRFRSRRLDRALADGARPEATPELALRARGLTALRHRRSLADAYRSIVREATGCERAPRLRVAPCRTRVAAVGEELLRLAEVLAEPGPVSACGVAQARLLVTDGAGPLYNAMNTASLRHHVARASSSLQLAER